MAAVEDRRGSAPNPAQRAFGGFAPSTATRDASLDPMTAGGFHEGACPDFATSTLAPFGKPLSDRFQGRARRGVEGRSHPGVGGRAPAVIQNGAAP